MNCDERLRKSLKRRSSCFAASNAASSTTKRWGRKTASQPAPRWDDIPEDWSCPDCGAAKSDFEMMEVARS